MNIDKIIDSIKYKTFTIHTKEGQKLDLRLKKGRKYYTDPLKGGSAIVVPVIDIKTKKQYAMKILHSNSQEEVERLCREGRIDIDSDQVIRYYGSYKMKKAGEWYFFIIMEWFGEALYDSVVDKDEKISICMELMQGVSAIHKNRLIHRDISPYNVLVEDGSAKITDFGRAKVEGTSMGTTTVWQTAGYSAPEVVLGAKEVTQACDVYSLAMVIYYLLYGAGYFEVRNLGTQFEYLNVVKKRFSVLDFSELKKLGYPAALCWLLAKMTVFDPDKRISVDAAKHEFMTIFGITPSLPTDFLLMVDEKKKKRYKKKSSPGQLKNVLNKILNICLLVTPLIGGVYLGWLYTTGSTGIEWMKIGYIVLVIAGGTIPICDGLSKKNVHPIIKIFIAVAISAAMFTIAYFACKYVYINSLLDKVLLGEAEVINYNGGNAIRYSR